MKKALWIVMAAALAVAVVAASAQTEVLSANAVGYIKKTLPAGGKWVAMSIPLDSMTNSTLLFGQTSVAVEAPIGAEVAFWDTATQLWLGGTKSGKGDPWASAQAGYELQPGEGFFLKGDPLAVSDVEVTITGEVPADNELAPVVPGASTLGTLANPYPVDFTFGTSTFASNASVGSEVSFWDVDSQLWLGGVKSGKGDPWASAQADYIVEAGEAFFMKEVGAGTTWTVVKPYTWP